ncbi:unnamed protein product [Penicillium roqueforti FM164]|uniref:Genomic scaffold, ProqFM164S01 n=1 Tax=Penicillium roqueforti (strain FM164) TaxID=1365484 RepID=W6Q682_PENRF|nr:unnamed protein product [Penicillium roqueforti FM164]
MYLYRAKHGIQIERLDMGVIVEHIDTLFLHRLRLPGHPLMTQEPQSCWPVFRIPL